MLRLKEIRHYFMTAKTVAREEYVTGVHTPAVDAVTTMLTKLNKGECKIKRQYNTLHVSSIEYEDVTRVELEDDGTLVFVVETENLS